MVPRPGTLALLWATFLPLARSTTSARRRTALLLTCSNFSKEVAHRCHRWACFLHTQCLVVLEVLVDRVDPAVLGRLQTTSYATSKPEPPPAPVHRLDTFQCVALTDTPVSPLPRCKATSLLRRDTMVVQEVREVQEVRLAPSPDREALHVCLHLG